MSITHRTPFNLALGRAVVLACVPHLLPTVVPRFEEEDSCRWFAQLILRQPHKKSEMQVSFLENRAYKCHWCLVEYEVSVEIWS